MISECDRIILFSGLDVMDSRAPSHWVFPNETWSYDFESNTWTKMSPAASPPGGYYLAMAYGYAGGPRGLVWQHCRGG